MCIFYTRTSIRTVDLDLPPWWRYIYTQAFNEFDIASGLENSEKITERLFEKAKSWDVQAEMIGKIYNEIKYWVDNLKTVTIKKN